MNVLTSCYLNVSDVALHLNAFMQTTEYTPTQPTQNHVSIFAHPAKMPMKNPFKESDLIAIVQGTLANVLGCSTDETGTEVAIVNELNADSLDFVELRFNLCIIDRKPDTLRDYQDTAEIVLSVS